MKLSKFIKTRKKELIALTLILLFASSYIIVINVAELNERRRVSELKLPILQEIPFSNYTLGGMTFFEETLWAISPPKQLLLQINKNGEILSQIKLNISSPWGITWFNNSLYISDTLSGYIYRMNITTHELSVFSKTNRTLLKGIAWANDALFAIDMSAATLYRISASGKKITAVALSTTMQSPTDLDWNSSSLWVADIGHTRIYNFNISSGKLIKEYYSPGGYPTGVAWCNDSLWVYDNGRKIIYQVDPFAPREIEVPMTVPSWFIFVVGIIILPIIISMLHKQELYLDEAIEEKNKKS